MEHGFDVILTLTGGLCVALVLGLLMQSLKLSPLVGYLLAGIVIGPFTPGYVADGHIAEQFAEIGIILLMFGVGLHFHLKDLLAVKTIAITGALVQIGVAVGVTLAVMGFFGWSWSASLVLGMAISVASTVVLLRVLADNHALHTPTGHIAIGWLLVEDLFTVLVLVLMPSIWGDQAGGSLPLAIGLVLLKLTGLVAFALLCGRYVIPRLLGYVAKTRSRELFTLTILALALGIAVGSAQLFGASMALGAFLAGMVVGQSQYAARAASDALPMRDAFAVLFFVSTGMLFKPQALLEDLGLVLVTVAIVLIAKPLAALAIMKLMKRPWSMALPVALALAQVGEFSFILGTLGTKLGVLPDNAMNALVSAAIISIMLNPILYSRLPKLLGRYFDVQLAPESGPEVKINPHRAVVVGYGPVGRTLTRLLIENGIKPTVIELNPTTISELESQGIRVVYGDASQREILINAGIEKAGSLFMTASVSLAAATVQHARELNPGIKIVARSAYLREIDGMQAAGAEQVFSEEGEIAMAMTGYLLWELGASADQIDRERERLRGEMFRQAV